MVKFCERLRWRYQHMLGVIAVVLLRCRLQCLSSDTLGLNGCLWLPLYSCPAAATAAVTDATIAAATAALCHLHVLLPVRTVYKTHAVLPFVILPALKVALAKVLLAPVIMPKALIRSLSSGSEFNTTGHQPLYKVPELDMGDDQFNITSTKMTHPADFMKFAFEDLSMAGEGVVKALVNGSCNPLELVAKGILNVNASEVMGVIPQVGVEFDHVGYTSPFVGPLRA